jgi:GNAT superfamily N-acetyltransferase
LEISHCDDEVELRHIVINPEYRRKGHAKRIVSELVTQCRCKGLNLFADSCNSHMIEIVRAIIKEWELESGYHEDEMEEELYSFYLVVDECY